MADSPSTTAPLLPAGVAASYSAILLAAGRGARFDASGAHNKLLQPLPSGVSVAATSASHLLAVLPQVTAVVRTGAEPLAEQLQALGCQVSICPDAAEGMGTSLRHGLQQSLLQMPQAKGWLIALADMPAVQPATIAALIEALERGADIAAPSFQGQRGNPVAFSRTHLPRLLQLQGDQGARSLLRSFPVAEVVVEDVGIRFDIDTEADLERQHVV
jgi:molybdenum cofactor cytidylyltransferase